ncbi:MAG TPA: SDR family oxidoreductase [Candidatus Paceibacterota bacterium]
MNKENVFQLFSLKDKVAVITGGAGMLGQEYAQILSDAGARVVLFDVVPQKEIDSRIKAIASPGRHIVGMTMDISKEKQVKEAVKKVVKKFGAIDILVNNAAATDFAGFKNSERFAPYEDFSLDIWEKEIGVGLTGTLICSQAVIPFMKKAKSGVIVNISSTHGVIAPDNRIYGEGKFKAITYPVIKSGILGFTRAMASYLAPYNVRVNSLVPGGVKAGYLDAQFEKDYSFRTMLGKMASKEDYKGAMLFLCSDASSYMTGSSLIIDGGWTAW